MGGTRPRLRARAHRGNGRCRQRCCNFRSTTSEFGGFVAVRDARCRGRADRCARRSPTRLRCSPVTHAPLTGLRVTHFGHFDPGVLPEPDRGQGAAARPVPTCAWSPIPGPTPAAPPRSCAAHWPGPPISWSSGSPATPTSPTAKAVAAAAGRAGALRRLRVAAGDGRRPRQVPSGMVRVATARRSRTGWPAGWPTGCWSTPTRTASTSRPSSARPGPSCGACGSAPTTT